MVKENGGSFTIAWRHRDHGPSRNIFAKISENLALLQEGDQPIKIAHDFGVKVLGLGILGAVRIEGEPSNEQEIEITAGIPDILLEQPDKMIKTEG